MKKCFFHFLVSLPDAAARRTDSPTLAPNFCPNRKSSKMRPIRGLFYQINLLANAAALQSQVLGLKLILPAWYYQKINFVPCYYIEPYLNTISGLKVISTGNMLCPRDSNQKDVSSIHHKVTLQACCQ